MSRFSSAVAAIAFVAAVPGVVCAQQSDLIVSPFMTFLPASGGSPLTGLALTMAGNGGLALRASGHLSLNSTNTNPLVYSNVRPWAADADAVLFLGGRYLGGYARTLAPYGFAGLGIAGTTDVSSSQVTHNWSYGAGLTVPVGSAIDLFGESRWRMSQYVLPTARYAPTPVNELRFGVSFHVGGGGNSRESASPPRRRSRSAAGVVSASLGCPDYPPTR